MKSMYLTGIVVLSLWLGYSIYKNIDHSRSYNSVNTSVKTITDQISELEAVINPFEKSVKELESNVKNSFLDNNRFGSIPDDGNIDMLVPKQKVLQLQNSMDSLNVIHNSVINQLSATQRLNSKLLDLEIECLKPIKRSFINMESAMGMISLLVGILGLWIAYRQELRQLKRSA